MAEALKSVPCSGETTDGMVRFPDFETAVRALAPADAVYCLHPDGLRRAAQRFLQGFPGRVLFAVKANPHPEMVKGLYAAGIRHFDTASLREIALVSELCPGATCYYMAVARQAGAARAAYEQYGVRHFVADHISEVQRLLEFASPDTTIHIRMKAFDPSSVYELSSKFGAEETDATALLRHVAKAGCRVGLTFNVGSLCTHSSAYAKAIHRAARVVRDADVQIVSLDVGGGFPTPYPGVETQDIGAFFAAIDTAFSEADFPAGCVLMCEPGRALVAEGQSLITQVILVKDDMVFLNDGIYGALGEIKISSGLVSYPVKVIRDGPAPTGAARPWQISGPTCDTLDILPINVDLPGDIRAGDWVVFSLTGAYSNAMAMRFNGLYADRWVRIEP